MKSHISICVVMALLTGCGTPPGMSMRPLPDMPDPPQVPGVKIIPISADAIAQNESAVREAAGRQELASAGNAAGYDYHIGVHDILTIVVWDHPELTIPAGEFSPEAAGYLVSEDGSIFYPYVGKISVAGKTTAEVREAITRGLEELIQKPQVDVKVAAYRSQKVYVTGEVARPGPQPITDTPATVQEALGLAGDVTQNGDLAHITLTRDGKTYGIDMLGLYDRGDTTQNVLLENGDVLHVPDRNTQKVFVIGEVLTPSSIVMNKRGMTLTEAIADAGGVQPVSSDPAHTYVIRGTEKETEIYYLNARSPDALVLGDHFRLQPRDVVFVETAPLARFGRVIDQILPASNIARNLGRLSGPQ